MSLFDEYHLLHRRESFTARRHDIKAIEINSTGETRHIDSLAVSSSIHASQIKLLNSLAKDGEDTKLDGGVFLEVELDRG